MNLNNASKTNQRGSFINQPIIHDLFSSLVGIAVLSLVSIWQKAILGAAPLAPEGFIIPTIVGAIGGFILGASKRKRAQAYRQLQESEALYRTLIEQASDAIFITDAEGNLLNANSSTYATLGYTREETLQLNLHDLIPINDQPQILTYMKELQTKESIFIEHRTVHKDGSLLFVETSATQLPNGHILGIARDITERKQAEAALRESEEKYRLLTETATDAIISYNFDGRITYANKAALKLSGYTEQELPQISFSDLLRPKQMAEFRKRFAQRKAGYTGVLSFETEFITKQGQCIPLEAHSATLIRQGKPLGILVISRDITERRQTQAALQESEMRFQRLMRESPISIGVYAPDGTLLDANHTWEKMWQVDAKAAIGAYNILTTNLFDRMNVKHLLKRAFTGEQVDFPDIELHPTLSGNIGRKRWLKTHIYTIKDEQGEVKNAVILSEDITERKQAEEALHQLQKTESLGVLAGGVAHDFNNLLVAMLGQTSLAQAKLSNESPARPHINKAVKAAERAADLTRQMLAYSGRGHFETRLINLNSLITENLHLFQASLPKNVRLRSRLADSLPVINADAGQMQQVIMNLIINGAQAIDSNPGQVIVTTGILILKKNDDHYTQYTGQKLSPGRYITLEIHDDGQGMSPDTLSKIFDPFFSTKEKGHGLGLAAVLGIVRGHNGGLHVYSEPGKGTTFKLLFPANQDKTIEPIELHPAIQKSSLKKCLLVIDDESAVREAVTDIMELQGIDVIAASNGKDGIALYQERMDDVGLVLLDLSMPGMDGAETFRELRAINPDVRVILSSGYNQIEATRNFSGKGLAAFVQKPYRADDLVAAVEQHMQ